MDTCHIWAAGYDIATKYEKVMEEFDTTCGLQHLKVIHTNDSKKPLGSRVDRHADIGQGTIGLEAFKELMNDPRLSAIPKILETPSDQLADYAHNMQILLGLI